MLQEEFSNFGTCWLPLFPHCFLVEWHQIQHLLTVLLIPTQEMLGMLLFPYIVGFCHTKIGLAIQWLVSHEDYYVRSMRVYNIMYLWFFLLSFIPFDHFQVNHWFVEFHSPCGSFIHSFTQCVLSLSCGWYSPFSWHVCSSSSMQVD
jgi:hypothetical protein